MFIHCSCSHHTSLQAIRHEKLNQPSNACEEDPDYNFSRCVKRSILRKAGCQPPWMKSNMKGLPLCENKTSFGHYDYEKFRVFFMNTQQLIEDTKCLMPCTFMEYKVNMMSNFVHESKVSIFRKWENQKNTLAMKQWCQYL